MNRLQWKVFKPECYISFNCISFPSLPSLSSFPLLRFLVYSLSLSFAYFSLTLLSLHFFCLLFFPFFLISSVFFPFLLFFFSFLLFCFILLHFPFAYFSFLPFSFPFFCIFFVSPPPFYRVIGLHFPCLGLPLTPPKFKFLARHF